MGRESVKFEAVLNFQSEARRKRVKEGREKVEAGGGAAWRKVNMDDQHINSRSNKSGGRVTTLHLPPAPSGRRRRQRRRRTSR